MRTKFLNYNIDNLTFDETIDKIIELINSGKTNQHVVLNAAKITLMGRDKKLAKIVNSCDLISADGISIVWASKFLGNRIKERVTGIDLFSRLLEIADQKRYRIYLLGANEDVIKASVKKMKEKYKGLTIVGYRNGFFNEEDEIDIVNGINQSNSHILFVGISTPKKEYFLDKYKNKLKVPFCMGVGGSFDITAGRYQRAPRWMQRLGLEWYYRLIQEPRRMWKRYSIDNYKFIYTVLKFKIFKNYNISASKRS